ncbi:hydroxymethylglutaryl-CoA synthase [Chloroflexota bacterium]
MSSGIVSYGAYIPFYRMSSATLAKTWGGGSGNSEKAVANWDEDSLTMAVEAAIDSLTGMDRDLIDNLYLATTTPPYREKLSTSIIAKVLDLRKEVYAADFTNSVRAGTIALKAAIDSIKAGSARQALLTFSEHRVPAPDSDFEKRLGDGAAALVLGDSDVAVEIEGSYSFSSHFIDIWRREGDKYLNAWEDRFIIEYGYEKHISELLSSLFAKYNLAPKDFTRVVMYAYDERRHRDLARKLGFVGEQMQNPLLDTVGHTGTASTAMMLVAALEEANPGDRILWINYSDGADAYILRVTDKIKKLRDRRGIKSHLTSKKMIPHYGMYLHFRDLMTWAPSFGVAKYTSLPMSWRDRDWMLPFKGGRCKQCGMLQFPPQRVCSYCNALDQNEWVKLADKKGTLFTYSLDSLAAIPDPPNVVAIVDLDGGGRFSTSVTDCNPDQLAPGMPVELTFRKFHEGKGVINYFWKSRPIRV